MKNSEIRNHAYMLTQYETIGFVGMNEFKEYFIHEIAETPSVNEINEYLLENNYETFYQLNDIELNDVLSGMTPDEIVKVTYFGHFNYSDDWFTFNGCGNLQSYSESEIEELYGKETKEYMFDSGYYDDDEIVLYADEIIETCNEMIEQGY